MALCPSIDGLMVTGEPIPGQELTVEIIGDPFLGCGRCFPRTFPSELQPGSWSTARTTLISARGRWIFWDVDLLGRVGGDADIPKIVEMANDDADPRVRQEATAALGKYLRFRGGGEEVLAAIQFSREEDDDKVLRAQEMVRELLADNG